MSSSFRIVKNNKLRVKREVDVASERAFVIIGIMASNDVARLAPVDSGTLKNSIDFIPDKDKVTIGSNLEYSIYQEFGTIHMPAANKGRGYFRPALKAGLKNYKLIMLQELINIR